MSKWREVTNSTWDDLKETTWKEVRLGDVTKRTQYGYTASAITKDTGVKFLRITDIVDCFIDWARVPYCDINKKDLEKYILTENDLVIARTGATAGRYKLMKKGFDQRAVFASYLIRFKIDNNNIIPTFLNYYLGTSSYRGFIENYIGGSAQPNINANTLSRFKFKIPGLETQEKIAHILSTYDKLIENNNRRIEILEKTAEEIYKEWFVRMRFPGHENTKFEKGIPQGWEVKKVGDIVNRLQAGHFYKEEELEGEGKVIVIDQSTKEYMGFHNSEPTHVAYIENPIILFGDHSCKMLVITRDFSLGENVIPFISSYNDPVLFLYYSLKRLIKTEEYKRHWKELINKKIYYPEIRIQEKFRDTIKDNIVSIEKYKHQNQNLIKQRDLLLPRLMNGTIEVK